MIGNLLSALVWLQSTSFASYMLSRVIGGLSEGNVQLAIAILSDVTTPETRAKALAHVGIAFAICFCIGPPIGAYFASRPLPSSFTASGFELNVYAGPAALTLGLLTLETIFLVFALPETRGKAAQKPYTNGSAKAAASGKANGTIPTSRQGTVAERLTMLKSLQRLHFLFLGVFSGVEFTLTFLTFDLFDWNNKQNGALIGSIGIISALLQGGYVRRAMSKVGEGKMAERGVSSCALGLVFLTILPHLVNSNPSIAVRLLQGAAVCMAMTSATVVNALTAWASLQTDDITVDPDTGKTAEEHPELAKGKALGKFRSSGQLGRAIGPLLACASYWTFGPSWTYAISAVAMFALSGRMSWPWQSSPKLGANAALPRSHGEAARRVWTERWHLTSLSDVEGTRLSRTLPIGHTLVGLTVAPIGAGNSSSMRFSTRNSYYLRISATTVLPLYLYLDERHVDWMSERVLQHVLADLRPLVIPKLNAEAEAQLGPGGPANAKRGTLDVHRGDTYQFGYFLRGTDPHAVLIKTRTFTAAPPRPPREAPPAVQGGEQASAKSSGRSRKTGNDAQKTTKKRKPKPRPRGKGKATAADDEEEAMSVSNDDDGRVEDTSEPATTRRRSKRARKVVAGGYRDGMDDDDQVPGDDAEPTREPRPATGEDDDYDPMIVEQPVRDASVVPKREEVEPSLSAQRPEEPSLDVDDLEAAPAQAGPSSIDVELVDDGEEARPKPILKLHYHGFNIHGRCLCVIVEPYPPLRSGTRAPSLAPTGLVAPDRAPSMAPPDFVPTGGAAQRERTPLFLPNLDRELTPAPSAMRTLPPVPLFSETAEGSDDEDSGMVLFSQILRSVGDHPPGIAEDDDEIEGAVFFGDADEVREL
ncbi:MFS general substrate transporter [Ganoderma sinense ZZ0214-1]|uniref:MFS general substrate transporter n=1 Tax=Ganoderma sinense ZZ0214-1 TaxID=1077348 RepID=A0A2G8STJ2_9APHY|nr:MFS general substrate transporter [Ganoderma sinense ZZ0214-1]